MSYDGQYMWINNANVPDMGAKVHRVTMDGLTDTDFSTAFKGASHQVTPLPDGSVAFYATGSNSCDDIKIFPAKGTPTSTATTSSRPKLTRKANASCTLATSVRSSRPPTRSRFERPIACNHDRPGVNHG